MGCLPCIFFPSESLRPLVLDSPQYSHWQPLSPFFYSSEIVIILVFFQVIYISTVLIAMSFNPNLLPSFGLTLPAESNPTNDLSLSFRRDVSTSWPAFSTPLNIKNTQNTRAQATFCYTNDTSNAFSDVDVETQSFSSVKDIPSHQFYGQKIADAVLRMLSCIRSFGRRIIRH